VDEDERVAGSEEWSMFARRGHGALIMKRVTRFFSVAALLLATSVVCAAPGVAQQRFEEGRALMKDNKPREAIPKFLASLAAEPTAAAALNLADAYERIGQTASAYHRFRQVEELTREKDPLRAQEAKKRADALYPRLATITVKPAQSPDARVTIDGAPLERTSWGTPRPFDIGSHEVIVEGGGRRIAKTLTIVAENDRLAVDPDELLREAAPPISDPKTLAPPPPPQHRPEESSSSPLRVVGVATAAVGIAGLVTGGVFGLLAFDAKSDLESRCPQYPVCPRGSENEVNDAEDRAKSLGGASTISFAIGGALVAAGVVLFLVAPSQSVASATARGVVIAF
jgi:hypothetical protein